jgi:LPS-assembly protein
MNNPLIRKPALKAAFLCASASFAAIVAPAAMAQIQDEARPQNPVPNPESVPSIDPLAASSADEIAFAAANLNYDNESDVVIALGQVEVNREAIRLRADRVTWNRKSGEVVAEGNVAIRNPEGDTVYGERVLLSDSLRDGVIDQMLVVLENGARLAANQGRRLENGNIELDNAAYSPCPVDGDDGCARKPSWQIRAVRVVYDKAHNKVRYKGARLEAFGLPIIPLPGLSHLADGSAGSGILMPDFRLSRSNGLEISVPYYLRIAPDRDVTITPHLYTNAAPMIRGELRALTDIGSFRVEAYATHGSLVPLDADPSFNARERRFRGYLDSAGRFQFDPRWSLSYSARVATDRTFMRRYDINRDDRMRSTINLERIGEENYLSISGWATQTLRPNDAQGQQPIALPLIDFRQRVKDPLLGGQFELQLNSLSLMRTSGQDTQRAFAGARWDWRGLTGLGQEITFTGLVRGDVYHTDENYLTPVENYRGKDGWSSRGIAAVAADMRWPFVGQIFGGTQTLTPRVQIVAAPSINNVDIPNEDARAFDLEDSNLFAINRFNGYDRFEDGTRITYGVEWNFSRPGLSLSSMVGQSYRLTEKELIFPDGTGLTDHASDIVGRSTLAYKDFLRLTHRFRLDKDNFSVRRNEIDASIGSRATYATIGYSRLNRDIVLLGEDLQDREEIRLGGRVAFARHWSIFGTTNVDLTSRREDPLTTSDGYEPIRHRLGVAYEDDCLSLGFTWRRDYVNNGDARSGNSFSFRVALRNLGF